jgi:hypothetical protein
MRRLLTALLVLVVLLVVADRVAAVLAEKAVADRIRVAEGLQSTPSVSIGDFPFLTQAVAGDYTDVSVTIHGLHRGGLAITAMSARLHGVHVPLSDVLRRQVGNVPVDSAAGTIHLDYADMNTDLAGKDVVVGYGGRPGLVSLRSLSFPVSGTVRLQVSGDELSAYLTGVRVAGLSLPVQGFGFTLALPSMPFGVRLTSVTSSASGVDVSAAASSLVLSPALR